VEANLVFGGLRLKIRGDVIDCKSHHTPSLCYFDLRPDEMSRLLAT
jgi:hypothetical protein